MRISMKVSMFKSATSKKSISTVLLKDWLLTSNSYSSLIKELREEENQARKKEIKDQKVTKPILLSSQRC